MTVIVSGMGISQLRLGLPITDVVPSHSSEWEFLTAQGKLFPVYHMRAVTKANFDYPSKQKYVPKLKLKNSLVFSVINYA